MINEELNIILSEHTKWLAGDEGKRADLSHADLSNANLKYADLSNADLSHADLSNANLRYVDLNNADLSHADLRGASLSHADLSNADLRDANLKYADLSNADLSFADLRGADLDYSCLPLWCGSLKTHFDDKQLVQIAYHLVKAGLQSKNASEETKNQLAKLIDFANKFHRVGECGEITY